MCIKQCKERREEFFDQDISCKPGGSIVIGWKTTDSQAALHLLLKIHNNDKQTEDQPIAWVFKPHLFAEDLN